MRPLRLLLALPLLLLASTLAQAADVRVLMAGEQEDDLAEVVALAKSAEHRLWVFAYTLSDKALVEVLAEKAALPGFDLRLLVDSEQAKKTRAQLAPVSASITPVVVPDDGRMHTKLMLVDGHTVLMGSKNWSNLAGVLKWNDVVVLRGKKLVAQVEQTFKRVGGFKTKALPKAAPSDSPEAEPARVELLFSAPGNPGTRSRAALLALLRKARKRIHVGMFILSDPELVQAIWLKRDRVDVRVVLDAVQHRNLTKRVDAAGVVLRRRLEDLGPAVRMTEGRQLHHKLALIDDVVITGSANWSKAAWEKNHEVLAILRPRSRKATPRFLEAYRSRLVALWESAKGL